MANATGVKDKFWRIEALPFAEFASYDSQRSTDLSCCLEGTRTEVLARIRRWVADTEVGSSQVFLLNGMAGTGKTTIAYTIAQEAEDQEILGATYFFSAQGDEDLRQVKKVISSIAYQLSRFNAEYKYHLAEALDESPQLATKTVQRQMKGLIIGPLQRISRVEPIIIVLDALDECGDRGLTEILQLIIGGLIEVKLPLRILLTSRPEPHILAAFRRFIPHQGLILHNIEESVVHADIGHFLRHRLAHTTFDPPLSPNWIGDRQLDTLVRDSGKLFIYAVTAVRFIHDNRVHPPHEQLHLLLTESTHLGTSDALIDLDNLYLRLLDTAVSTRSRQLPLEQIRDVIGALVLLREPLSVVDLERFLAATPGYVRAALYPLHSVVLSPESDDGIPRIFHQSFRDFIVDRHRSADSRLTISIQEHEKRLAICCLDIMLNGLHYDMAKIGEPLAAKSDLPKLAERITPEMSYACRFWVSHIRMVEPGDRDVMPLLDQFSSRCVLWWIEVCSVLNSVNTAISSSYAAREWANSSSCLADTTNVLNDIYRLLLAHGSLINEYPLQTYMSAFPFAPLDTALRRIYDTNGIHTVKVICGQVSWSASLAVWIGHHDCVSSVAFSHNGARVVSGSWDRTVMIWDSDSGDAVVTLNGHNGEVNSVDFSPDGSNVVSGSDDHSVRIWDAVSGDVMAILEGHSGAVYSVAFSPDGSRVLSGSEDSTVRIWGALSGNVMITLESHSSAVYSVAFSPDGSRVVSGSDDHAVWIWDAISGDVMAVLEGHEGRVTSVTSLPNGSRVISSSTDGTARIWDTVSGHVMAILEGHSKAVNCVTFSFDGSRVVSGSRDRTVRIWDAGSGDLIATLEGHSGAVYSVAFSPDGSRVVSCAADSTIRIWDALPGGINAPLESHDKSINSVALSLDASRVVTGSSDSMVRIWDTVTGDVMVTLEGHDSFVTAVGFSPDGSKVVSGSDDNTVRVWDVGSGDVVSTLKHFWVDSVAFSADGSRVVSCSRDHRVRVWDLVSEEVVIELENCRQMACSIAPSLTSATSFVNANNELTDWPIPQNDSPIFTLESGWILWENRHGGPAWICELPSRFTDDDIPMDVHGSIVALGNVDGTVTVLDLSSVMSDLHVS